MDYMQEVGHRQQKALTALLLGRGEEQTRETQPVADSAVHASDGETATVVKVRDRETAVEAVKRAAETETSTAEGTDTASQMQAEEIHLLRRAEADEDGATNGGRQGRLESQSEEYRLSRSADTVWRDVTANRTAQSGRIFRASAAADSWDAAAMSRIFQRDARRYDGSFRTD